MTINVYSYGSDIIAVETCCAGHGPMKVGCGNSQVKAIDDLEGTPIEGHLDDALGLRWFLSQMQDSETDADELELLDDEDKSDVSDWETVATYVSTFPNGDTNGACDVEVQIGRSGGGWYLQSKDDAGGSDDCDGTAYETEEAAREAAEEFASENDEGEAGEDAEKYLARQLEEAAGDPCDDGEYCVYWSSACKEDEGVSARYETAEQATAAAEINNKGLHEHNPGQLLCGFEVRQLTSVDGHMQWVAIEE
jgi:hypothetical protein